MDRCTPFIDSGARTSKWWCDFTTCNVSRNATISRSWYVKCIIFRYEIFVYSMHQTMFKCCCCTLEWIFKWNNSKIKNIRIYSWFLFWSDFRVLNCSVVFLPKFCVWILVYFHSIPKYRKFINCVLVSFSFLTKYIFVTCNKLKYINKCLIVCFIYFH